MAEREIFFLSSLEGKGIEESFPSFSREGKGRSSCEKGGPSEEGRKEERTFRQRRFPRVSFVSLAMKPGLCVSVRSFFFSGPEIRTQGGEERKGEAKGGRKVVENRGETRGGFGRGEWKEGGR